MTVTDDTLASHARSSDGTEIAYWTSGAGPPLVLVHGAPADHTRWRPLLPFLEPHLTAHAMDRRGRGASGDAPAYELTREFEDVAAVVEAIAGRWGGPVDVYGHSFGGLAAFGGAALTDHVRRLVLYEGWPSTDPRAYQLSPELDEHLDALMTSGDREEIIAAVFRELAGVSDDELETFRSLPSWPARLAAAHTLPREVRALPQAVFDVEWTARISAPTLLIHGSESTDPATRDVDTLAGALPRSRVAVLQGHGHVADVLAPDVFSELLLGFLRD
jgi:pimeloyl-ACP methyl ester carboxylesterase